MEPGESLEEVAQAGAPRERPPVSAERTSAASPGSEFARLVAVDGSAQAWNLLQPTTLIGTAEGCHARLTGAGIAPLHALISLDAGVLRLRDLGLATSGTKVNGKPVQVARLRDGDTLTIGAVALRVETSLAKRKLGGMLVDHYKVTQILAAGGMCWLYLAEDLHTGRPVALKMLPKNHKPRMRIRFELEARAGLRVDHPNVVRTFRIDHTEDVYYIVMEYMPGISLHELVALAGPLPWPRACSLVAQVAAGLDHVHAKGMIHRDVKPANVLVDRQGRAKLVDFGLALLEGEEVELSLSQIFGQQFVGTADFIAPEQSLNSFAIDPRADLFSLGATLYFALTGGVPFPGGSKTERVRARHTMLARPLREVVPDVLPAVAALVERLLAVDPAARFASANEVAKSLEPFVPRFDTQPPLEFDLDAVLRARLNNVRQRTASIRAWQEQAVGSRGDSRTGSTAASSVASSAGSSAATTEVSIPRSSARESVPTESVQRSTNGTPSAPATDPDLGRVLLAWPDLPDHARRVILALIQADATSKGKSEPS